MKLQFQATAYAAAVAVLFIPEPADANSSSFPKDFNELTSVALQEAAPWLAIAPAWRDFKAKKQELVLAYGPAAAPVSRILLVGLGQWNKLSEVEQYELLRESTAKAMQYCRERSLETVGLEITTLKALGLDLNLVLTEVVSSAYLGLYRNMQFKSELKEFKPDPKALILLGAGQEMQVAANYGRIKAEAVNIARELSNTPANHLTPTQFATKAVELAKHPKLSCEVLDMAQLQALGCGALVAVGQGSINPPCLVILEYTPENLSSEAAKDPLVIVGKGITFDSGGISLKPSEGMWEMKSDCGGATAVFGLMSALSQLEVPRRVIGLLALAENMPDGKACRPGDVLATHAGKTVEIISTDAEGRLVLCDALSYAQKRWQPTLMVDIATLTGASVVALGDYVAAVFATKPELAMQVRNWGLKTGEKFWPMPLDEAYMDYLKSETADFTNAGPRFGGACTAAIFLKQFVNSPQWIHLDIAGPGFIGKSLPLCQAGGTGFGVMTLLELVQGELA